jgi:hypothetical protein
MFPRSPPIILNGVPSDRNGRDPATGNISPQNCCKAYAVAASTSLNNSPFVEGIYRRNSFIKQLRGLSRSAVRGLLFIGPAPVTTLVGHS